ncbi:MAG: DMT family transporter [Rhodoferax sp.]|uniref:DMT family transporter n=1 Tax=Rhodoferax sp. TaxID=50421 RepID=UPI003263A9A5
MQTKYFVQLVALSALWGSTFMLTRLAVPTLGHNLAAGMRMVMATLVLGTIMRVARQPWPWAHWREMFLLGALAVAGPHFFYAWSSLELPAAYGSLLSVTAVLFGAFISAYMKEEALTPLKTAGCLLGFGGAALVVQLGPVSPTPLLVLSALGCVAGAALSGISTPFLKRATTRLEPLAITAGMHAAGALLLLPGALYDLPKAHFTLSAVACVVVMGTMTSGMAYWMYMRIMRHVPPVAALSSTFLITGFGVLFSIIFLGEATGPGLYAGGTLIVLASMMVMGFNPLRRRAA